MTSTTNAEVPLTTSIARPSSRSALIHLLILGLVVFLTALDQTMVVTALLPMALSLGLTPQDLSALSWVISGYLLGYVIVMPLMGRVADAWGRRRLMLICLGIFAAGSLLCVEAPRLAHLWDLAALGTLGVRVGHPALAWLIAARFVQAVGGGAIVPIALASSGALAGTRRRGLALGFIAGVTEAGGALGPLYGAVILEKWPLTLGRYSEPWMWLFLLNVPFAVVLAGLLWRSWPATARAPGSASPVRTGGATPRAAVDWIGSCLLAGALVCLSLGLSQQAGAMVEFSTQQQHAHDPYLLAAAAALTLGFVAVERRQSAPLIPLGFFRSGTFSASTVLSLLAGVTLIIALVNVPIFAYAVLGESHLGAGLILLRLTIMIPLGAFASGWLTTRLGPKAVSVGAALVIAAGFALMSRWTPETPRHVLMLGTMVTGAGFGLILAPLSTTALQTVDAGHFGVAAAVSTTARMIGMIVGLAALSSWEIGRFRQIAAALRAAPAAPGCDFACHATRLGSIVKIATAQAMAEAFLVAAIIAAAGIIPALFFRPPTDAPAHRD